MSMIGIGEKLKEAREKKGLTIEQAQKQTRIHSGVLTALEEGRCDDLLTATYVKSFLKKYSGYLGIDQKDVLKAYADVHPDPSRHVINTSVTQTEKSSPDLTWIIRFARSAVILIIVIFVIMFVWNKASRFIRNARQSGAAARRAARPIPSRSVSGAARSSNVTAADPASRKGHASKQVSGSQSPSRAVSPGGKTVIPKNASLRLSLIVKQPVLVGLKADNKLIFKRVMPKGTVELFTASDSFNIYVAKAEAIEMSLNDKPLGFLGKGVIKDLEITRNGIKVR